jgi:hypothetical protein
MELNGHDLRPFPLVARKQKLDTICGGTTTFMCATPSRSKTVSNYLLSAASAASRVSYQSESTRRTNRVMRLGEGEVRSGRKTIKIAVIFLRAEKMVGLDIAADEPHEAQSCGS